MKNKWRGHCFEAAFHALENIEGAVMVHGLPLGRGKIEGLRFAHAWAEVDDAVIDLTVSPEGNPIPRELYYALGQIDPAECYRYSLEDAHRWMLKTLHYGPWEGSQACGPATPF